MDTRNFWAPDDIILKERWFSAITRFLLSTDTALWRACKKKQREDKAKRANDDHEVSKCRAEQRNKLWSCNRLLWKSRRQLKCGEKQKEPILGENGCQSSLRKDMNSMSQWIAHRNSFLKLIQKLVLILAACSCRLDLAVHSLSVVWSSARAVQKCTSSIQCDRLLRMPGGS